MTLLCTFSFFCYLICKVCKLEMVERSQHLLDNLNALRGWWFESTQISHISSCYFWVLGLVWHRLNSVL
ncbi:hypothetical protein Lalb_Chr05g0212801 [Lupinus albus]|uniref:Uncharacterized protein n=1 Tax=Lupinus albus TaxID=3870 RepID=A0A6A4QF87_LUPAL|nr:hypothetical protein Lalb_Chr05g0212801 [Lupinus albus]